MCKSNIKDLGYIITSEIKNNTPVARQSHGGYPIPFINVKTRPKLAEIK